MKNQTNANKIVMSKIVFSLALILFFLIIGRIIYLGLATNIDGINIKKFALNRNTKKEIETAPRGTIYDSKANVLANNVSSYTVIAYLDSSRSKNSSKQLHVSDVKLTAEKLSPILNMSIESLEKLLSKKSYQVELGPGGRGITEIKKDEIINLNLPGIDFVSNYKRYYPNGDFVSYILGYAKSNDDNSIVGEMGIEKQYNKELTGTDGYTEYQKDTRGYKIPNTPEINKKAIAGNDIYLTIDSSIQLFVEQALITLASETSFDWVTINMMDAKTGKILATSSKPSFDPNIKNITNYVNPLTSFAYEPGSTMKTYTYMAAMEKGTYDGTKTFLSGKKEIGADKTVVNDWNSGAGWGTINYDTGYTLSSNVGISNMLETMINKKDLDSYFKKLGFGSKTGINLPKESSGKIAFKYPIEIANAGFGQGITTTPIQHLQALSSIANNGKMVKPYIIDKIVDVNKTKNNIIFSGKTEKSDVVASPETIKKIKDLMYKVINGEKGTTTGYTYKVEGYDLIGKTGTAQVIDPETGKYSDRYIIRSFAGMFPYDNPEVILYAAIKGEMSVTAFANAVKRVVEDTSKYLNLKSIDQKNEIDYEITKISNLINKNLSVKDKYKLNYVVLGNGNKIVDQYPKANTMVNNYEKVFLLTNGNEFTLPDINGYSQKDVKVICDLLNITCNISGSGYVSSYNERIESSKKILDIILTK